MARFMALRCCAILTYPCPESSGSGLVVFEMPYGGWQKSCMTPAASMRCTVWQLPPPLDLMVAERLGGHARFLQFAHPVFKQVQDPIFRSGGCSGVGLSAETDAGCSVSTVHKD